MDQKDPAAAAQDRAHIENRLVGKALKFWENARTDGGLPPISALDADDCPFGDTESMVIEVGANE